MASRFLVKTDYGDVLVEVNEACRNALGPDLLKLSAPTPENTRELRLEVPLRAFSAKMLDIIETVGTGEFDVSPGVLELMKKEKATADLARIERWAKARS